MNGHFERLGNAMVRVDNSEGRLHAGMPVEERSRK